MSALWGSTREPCPECGCPGRQFDGHVCEDYPGPHRFNVLARIGWKAGCWTGYPNRWYKRLPIVRWLERFDPVVYP